MYHPAIGFIIFGGVMLLIGIALIIFRSAFASGRWYVYPSNPRAATAMGFCVGILGAFFVIWGFIPK